MGTQVSSPIAVDLDLYKLVIEEDILITGGRHQPYYHSEYRQVKSMRKMHPNPIMQIHPETAKELGIEDEGRVWIESHRDKVKQKCKIFDGINPRMVHAQHG